MFSSSVPFALAWVGVYRELQWPSVTTVSLNSLSAVLKTQKKVEGKIHQFKRKHLLTKMSLFSIVF